MNHLDSLKSMRIGPPWATCVRADYQLIGMTETYSVECWHSDAHGPILDAGDLRSLEWTTAEISALDDATLSIIDPSDAGRHISIKPLLFQDVNGDMRLGWPMAGYVDPTAGERWVRSDHRPPVVEPEINTSSDDGGGPSARSHISVAFQPAHLPPPIANHPTGEFHTMPNGPAHISGTFIVHISLDEIDDMMDDNMDDSPPFIENGEIKRTRAIQVKDVVEAAAEKVSPKFADLVADLENAEVSPDPDDGFRVTFTFDLDV